MDKYIVFECLDGFAVDIKAYDEEVVEAIGYDELASDWVTMPRVVIGVSEGEGATITVKNGALNKYAHVYWKKEDQGWFLYAAVDAGKAMLDWIAAGSPSVWSPEQWEQ